MSIGLRDVGDMAESFVVVRFMVTLWDAMPMIGRNMGNTKPAKRVHDDKLSFYRDLRSLLSMTFVTDQQSYISLDVFEFIFVLRDLTFILHLDANTF